MTTTTDNVLSLVRLRRAIRRLGLTGLLFFTAKGLLWLALPLLLAS